METSEKKILLNITYYTGVVLVIAFSILFMIAMNSRGVAMYQQIVYYIWAGLLVATMIFDVIATRTCSMKFIVGLLMGGLLILCLIMGIIVFVNMSTRGVIPTANIERFTLVATFSGLLSIVAMFTYCVGECLVEYKTNKR